jgi:O-antigen/teichoic acid export membrane protein
MRRDLATNLAGNLLLAVMAVASGLLIARLFGPEGRGDFASIQVIAAFAAGLGALGLGDAVLYRTASGHPVLASALVRLSLGAGVAAAVLAVPMGLLIGDGSGASGFVAFAIGAAAATAIVMVAQGATRGAGRFGHWNLARILANVAWIACLLAATIGTGVNLVAAAVVFVGGYLAVWVWLAIAEARRDAPIRRERPRTTALLRFGIPAALASVPALVNGRLDLYVLAAVSPTTEVGYYAAAVGYCWAIAVLSQAVANLAFTRVAERSEPVARADLLRRLSQAAVVLVVLAVALAWLLAPWALPLLNSDEFERSISLARILLLGVGCQSIAFVLEEGTRGLGLPKLAMWAEIAGLAVMGVLLAAVAQDGPTAVAWASSAGYATTMAVAVLFTARATGIAGWRYLTPSVRELAHLVRSPEQPAEHPTPTTPSSAPR